MFSQGVDTSGEGGVHVGKLILRGQKVAVTHRESQCCLNTQTEEQPFHVCVCAAHWHTVNLCIFKYLKQYSDC